MSIDRQAFRALMKRLDNIGPEAAPQIVAELKAMGAVRGIHVGRADLGADPEETLEWFAGQGLDILESEAWFAVNSYLNCVDKFAPENPHA